MIKKHVFRIQIIFEEMNFFGIFLIKVLTKLNNIPQKDIKSVINSMQDDFKMIFTVW